MSPSPRPDFDPHCRRCSRLATFLDQVKEKNPEYHCRPVPSFGDAKARVLIVGLAPGMHGANATGRPFTGDFAGLLLYRTLYRHGFSTQEHSESASDDLRLVDCRITNAVKCLPPANKPTTEEIRLCNQFLSQEIESSTALKVILALGRIAHTAVLRALDLKQSKHPFGHGARHALSGNLQLVDSYHCSRYNTQTRRLTEESFSEVFKRIKSIL